MREPHRPATETWACDKELPAYFKIGEGQQWPKTRKFYPRPNLENFWLKSREACEKQFMLSSSVPEEISRDILLASLEAMNRPQCPQVAWFLKEPEMHSIVAFPLPYPDGGPSWIRAHRLSIATRTSVSSCM
jgi:hypothetical protein